MISLSLIQRETSSRAPDILILTMDELDGAEHN